MSEGRNREIDPCRLLAWCHFIGHKGSGFYSSDHKWMAVPSQMEMQVAAHLTTFLLPFFPFFLSYTSYMNIPTWCKPIVLQTHECWWVIWYKLLRYTVCYQKHLIDGREKILMNQEGKKVREKRVKKHQYFFFVQYACFLARTLEEFFWILSLNASVRFVAFNWIILVHIF